MGSNKIPMDYLLWSHDSVATPQQKDCIAKRMTSFTNQPCLIGFSIVFIPYATYDVAKTMRYRKAGVPMPPRTFKVSPFALLAIYGSAIFADLLINRTKCYHAQENE
jgi:hypothetical protein